jgi:putative phosphoesterase
LTLSVSTQTKARVQLPMKADGSLRLGIVADTHSAPNEQGLRHLAAQKPDFILHGGDIGDLAVLEQLSAIAPVHAVRGNIDTRASHLPDVLVLELTHAGKTELTLLLTHIAIAGPRIRADAAKLARAAHASVILCGHSHVPFIGQERGLSIFNPGSIGPRRFHLPVLFGVMELSPTEVKLRHFDCETGAEWRP